MSHLSAMSDVCVGWGHEVKHDPRSEVYLSKTVFGARTSFGVSTVVTEWLRRAGTLAPMCHRVPDVVRGHPPGLILIGSVGIPFVTPPS